MNVEHEFLILLTFFVSPENSTRYNRNSAFLQIEVEQSKGYQLKS